MDTLKVDTWATLAEFCFYSKLIFPDCCFPNYCCVFHSQALWSPIQLLIAMLKLLNFVKN